MASRIKKQKIIWVVASGIVIVLVVLYFIFFAGGTIKLPSDLVAARQAAARVSEKIVDLTSETNEKIKVINSLDLGGDRDAAYALIREARETNGEAYEQAFELSRHLQKLTESLGRIESIKGQRIAYEAVAVELSLVSEFITYTQNLNAFLDNLSAAVSSDSSEYRILADQQLQEVNDAAIKINKLNQEFLSKINQFDESL